MDGTQTSEPTEAGPGSPGQASALRRALDETATTEGPLDLTVPLNLAEIRAALSTQGPHRASRPAAPAAPQQHSAPAAAARPQQEGAGHRGSRHAGPKRLGRIAAFVAVAAAMSVGTACALVLSNNAQNNTSVSLPANGAIPMAPGTGDSQPGQIAVDAGSTSAKAAPSPSRSTWRSVSDGSGSGSGSDGGSYGVGTDPATTASPTASDTPTSSASADPTDSATPDPSDTDPIGTQPPPDVPTTAYGSNWEVLYQGDDDSAQEEQETASVQSLLDELGYLAPWRHRTYFDPLYPVFSVIPDPHGFYGSATSDALAQFQTDYGVPYTDQLGACDLTTYQALTLVAG